MKRLFVCLVALALSGGPVAAARVKVWHHHKPSDHEKATLKNVVLSNQGTLRLSRGLTPLVKQTATHIWALAEDRAGNLYAGTGDEGKVYRITPAGKSSVVYSGEATQVLALAADPRGEVIYAGTGPKAQVIRIDGRGHRVLCELKATYVWALAADPRGEAVYAATGPHGKIYRITSDGKARVFHDTRQDHVLCLTVSAEGTLYAGTDKTGRVLRIDTSGKGFVLHQAPQSEVRSLLLANGVLYAGTSATKRRNNSSTRVSESSASARLVQPARAERAAVLDKAEKSESARSNATRDKETRGSKAEAPAAPAAGENSVWRIAPDGSVREVFRDRVLVMSLLQQGKRLLVGTGMSGQLFEVDEVTREKAEIARLDHGQILCLLRRNDGSVVLGTGDPGNVYVLSEHFPSSGQVVSEVLDAGLVSRWGALRWRADLPEKTGVSLAVRSGNVAEPDETWSDWSSEQANSAEAMIKAPVARFLQYRVTLKTNDRGVTPAIRSLTLRYAPINQAPEVSRVDVPDLGAANQENPKKVKLKWTATDANEDELRYRLLVKKDGWQRWVELEDNWDKSDYEWDTTTTPSGVYRLKVIASDRADNPDGEALTAERISAPFVVCHTPPTVKVSVASAEGGRVVLQGSAQSPLVRLTSASFAINGRKWVNLFPVDGLFDDRSESFRFATELLKPGTYVLVLRIQDAAGNTGSADVVFTVPLRPVARK